MTGAPDCQSGRRRGLQGKVNEFVEKGISMGRRKDLTGGGLIRSLGGWAVVKSMRKEIETFFIWCESVGNTRGKDSRAKRI